MANEYIYEFLYRGRAQGEPEPPAWHVVLRDPGTGQVTTLSVAQAEAAGWGLPTILDALNTAAVKSVGDTQAELTQLRDDVDAAREELAAERSKAFEQRGLITILQNQLDELRQTAPVNDRVGGA